MWKGFSACFSSQIPSQKAIPLVECFSLLVEKERQKKRRHLPPPFS